MGFALEPFREMGAHEALWADEGATFKRIADRFRDTPNALPSHFVPEEVAMERAHEVIAQFKELGVVKFGVQLSHGFGYLDNLRDAAHPVELFYYQGAWDWLESPSVAVVGTRNPSEIGKARTRKLVRGLVKANYTIVSGLAAGIDTEAHTAAMECGGATIGVIGTPLGISYPKENQSLQEEIARKFLVVSQIPILRYSQRDWRWNRAFFPERNVTMSAMTLATVIVEAGNTSGTLVQAKAALRQGRKLFILDSCFENKELEWPRKFEKLGAYRVRDLSDVLGVLGEGKAH